MKTELPDHSGTANRPPQIFTGILPQGLILDYYKPVPWLPMPVQYPVGLALIAGGLALGASAAARLREMG